MAVYLITYDLKKAGQNYDALYKEIKSFGDWWHYLESTWLVDTNLSAQTMSDRIRKVTDSNDLHLVIKLNRGTDYQGWLPKEAWDWINQRLR
ncbi:SinR family protein [Symbiobacterium thermophilum]|uniref:SinR family protein n=1 Tax=Symbiobacterium thermophilum TaxID=2734 RepID=A0A953LJ66_SYMTR|nr:SinR family protein [Symbiobacterium thermophilum]MBY6276799.1 hypothetical protein [Symbiobacterium thermophilum]